MAQKLTRREMLALGIAAGGVLSVANVVRGVAGMGISWPSFSTASDSTDTATETQAEPDAETQWAENTATWTTAADRALAMLSTEQKVAQLLCVTPDQLVGDAVDGSVTEAGDLTRAALERLPVGGLLFESGNINGKDQINWLLTGDMNIATSCGAGVPTFMCVEEEGGPAASPVASVSDMGVETFKSMSMVGASRSTEQATHIGQTIGTYLHDLGFNTDLAPVADVLTNASNTTVGQRAFSSDPEVVSQLVVAEVTAMDTTGVLSCVKHFPGHGDAAADATTGAVSITRTLDQLRSCEFVPFAAAIGSHVPMVLVGHIQDKTATGDELPATLSATVIGGWLRNELAFEGVVVSDAMNKATITDTYSAGDAALMFIQAGGDLIMKPADPQAAYDALVAAVENGTISDDRLNESVRRILFAKARAGLLGEDAFTKMQEVKERREREAREKAEAEAQAQAEAEAQAQAEAAAAAEGTGETSAATGTALEAQVEEG